MAGYLKHAGTKLIAYGLPLCLALAVSALFAQPLLDPTRPSALFTKPQASTPNLPDSATTPVLQSVLISPERRIAVINGQTLKLGDKYNRATLEKIDAHEVFLREGNQVHILKLFPGLEKKSQTAPAPHQTTLNEGN